MMDCRQANNLIGLSLNGALAADESVALEAHLSSCAKCRQMSHSQSATDAALRRSFADHRRRAAALAERVATRITIENAASAHRSRAGLFAAAGIAAGFLLAAAIFRPWQTAQISNAINNLAKQPTTLIGRPAEVLARLTLSTGPIEFLAPGDTQWQPLPTGGVLHAGTSVRTGAMTCCEFTTADDSEVRMNRNTELTADGLRRFTLASGQAWSTVAKHPMPFEIRTGNATITALGTQFDVSCQAAQTCITVVEGRTRVVAGASDQTVSAGEEVCITAGGSPIKKRIDDLVEATRWVHDLLVLKGHADPELQWRVDDLLARIGRSKMEHLHEQEIKSLGDRCVAPLAKYVTSPQAAEHPHRRARAAAILSEMAQPWNIPDLITLLDNADGEVRYHAAVGLKRLTGETLGHPLDSWRNTKAESCSAGSANWKKWWEDNKSRYPVGR